MISRDLRVISLHVRRPPSFSSHRPPSLDLPSIPQALLCLGALAAAAGAELAPHLEPLLPAVLALPLSPELTRSLRQLGAHVPALGAQATARNLARSRADLDPLSMTST